MKNSSCGICSETLEGIVFCQKCGMPHHRDCIEFVGKCATYACGVGAQSEAGAQDETPTPSRPADKKPVNLEGVVSEGVGTVKGSADVADAFRRAQSYSFSWGRWFGIFPWTMKRHLKELMKKESSDPDGVNHLEYGRLCLMLNNDRPTMYAREMGFEDLSEMAEEQYALAIKDLLIVGRTDDALSVAKEHGNQAGNDRLFKKTTLVLGNALVARARERVAAWQKEPTYTSARDLGTRLFYDAWSKFFDGGHDDQAFAALDESPEHFGPRLKGIYERCLSRQIDSVVDKAERAAQVAVLARRFVQIVGNKCIQGHIVISSGLRYQETLPPSEFFTGLMNDSYKKALTAFESRGDLPRVLDLAREFGDKATVERIESQFQAGQEMAKLYDGEK